ncbi:hypothetical protein AAE02nite_34590 [Adhaeribacter aerolatus]|uniref:Peptidase S8/S53 domain-containing protein n=2 Tax=Adhaeribacter aerolatus TaxID=670289 RepID=A0A512B1G6_9BACT|nr:hypothetical protein AAE02nite_34590 [Adhaeribacter aerolatus]
MAGCQNEDKLLEEQAPKITAAETPNTANIIQGKYIVVFKDKGEKTTEIIDDLVFAKKVNRTNISESLEGRIQGFTGKLSSDQLKDLRNNPEVASIEPDQVISLDPSGKSSLTAYSTEAPSATYTMPAQPAQSVPWGVNMVGRGDGTGKTAWVIDSGVDVYHPDLKVDIARSVSFVTGLTSVQDGYGHGTMVAGIIGAKNNTIGVVGVAANATIVALRVLDNNGAGSLSNLIRAVNHVGTYGKAGDVVNISIGAAASSILDNAIKTAAAKGIYFSIAAGNSAVDCSNTSPQRVNATNVYTVSAMDANKYFWNASNFGAPVDRAAPGVNITTTGKNGTYTYGHGTSFAAPHVAGLLLLRGNYIGTNGTVIGDKDSWTDQIAKL